MSHAVVANSNFLCRIAVHTAKAVMRIRDGEPGGQPGVKCRRLQKVAFSGGHANRVAKKTRPEDHVNISLYEAFNHGLRVIERMLAVCVERHNSIGAVSQCKLKASLKCGSLTEIYRVPAYMRTSPNGDIPRLIAGAVIDDNDRKAGSSNRIYNIT